MKLNFTFKKMYGFKYVFLAILLLYFSQEIHSQSVRVYAQSISSQSNTDNASNATDANLTTRARVRASSGLALGIGAYSGHLELQYPATVPANTTSYIKIQTDDELLPSLLGGSLGGLLANVAGAVLIGNQEFTIQAKNNSTVVLQGDSQDIGEFSTNRLRIVTDPTGDYYIAITPAQAYNRVRFTNRIGSLLGLFNVRNLDVYDAFYISSADNCGRPSYTSYDGSGITLDLLNLSGAGVTNAQNAIDTNLNSYSQLSLGILGVAASIEQTAYFDGPSNANDQFNIRMRLDPSLLEVGVANSIQLVAQNGPNTVQTITLSSLLNAELLTLLQGNQIVTIPFQTVSPANKITVRYNGLVNIGLNQSLDLFDISRVPRPPVIIDAFTLDPKICSGSTASLIAMTSSGYELQWFSTAQSGSPLATTQSGQPFVTPALNSDTSYYVAAIRTGCTELSSRIRVRVHVVTVPTAADISVSSPLSACQGNITISPTTSLLNSSIKYFTSQDMTQEITTGYSGNPGVTYVKNTTTGTLSISGLTSANSPYHYFVALQVEGLCTNTAGTLKEVVVNYSQQLVVSVNSNLQGCNSVNLADAILNFDPNNTYTFYNGSGTAITAEAAASITTSGNYSIQAQGPNGTCASTLTPVIVTVNQQPQITLSSNALVTTVGNSVTLNATTSAGTIVWYNASGIALASNTTPVFTATGVYSFTAVATNAGCSSSAAITVTVLDPASCPPLTQPDFATMQSWSSILTGGVSNAPSAVDANLQTYSTITTGVGLLGVGTTWQTLQWEETIAAGTPVTIKLGSQYSGLTLIGGFSVIGTKRNASGVPQTIGTLQAVSGSLVDLLPGQNTFEYTFVPSNTSGPQAYDGVRIVIGSTVSVAQNAKVFDAYYYTAATQVACGDDVRDVLYGAVDLGVGALTSTVGVNDPFQAIDNSTTTAATMYSGLGVLAAAELTVVFNTPSIQGDQVRMRLSKPGTVLSAGVLAGLTIQPMLNNAVSGTAISSAILSVELLNGGQSALVTFTPNATFDRLRIRFGGVAGVLEFLNVHDVERLANTHVLNADVNNNITACQGQTISLEAASVPCTSFIWYDSETGGNVVATGNSFAIPATLAAGPHTFWIQPIRFGCSFLSRGKVTVNVTETAPENAIQSISINGSAQTSICAPNGNVTLLATLNSTLTITNPVFYWYASNGTTLTQIANQTGSSLPLTGLAPGTYTYFVGISSNEYCQTAADDRTQITFTILPPSSAADISVADVGICLNGTVVITPTSSLASAQFTYYFSNNLSQSIADGQVVGTATFDIAADGSSLTITGLSDTSSPYTFYVAVTSASTCINQAGNLADVVVTVGSLPTPTTNSTTQNFCSGNNPTVADIQVNESGVLFYTASTGGTLLSASTPLVNGTTYYASLSNGICQSTTRLAITVTIGNPATPTTEAASQNFCAVDNPTVADIQVNETGVVFYNLPVGGTAYASASPLTAGTYYAAIIDGICQSTSRLAITVTISNPATPTTSNTAQEFCAGNNPTVADLDINESNVTIYDMPDGGQALAAETPLASGTYYVTQVESATGCESSVRLVIDVNVTTVPTPTTSDDNQDFCLANAPTVANIQVNETGVVFYDAASGGNSYDPTAPLVSGIYYAALIDGICESDIRLEITVNVNDPATPTTDNATQIFCLSDNPTVADIQVNETTVVFYDAETGGTIIDPATPLTAGMYYAVNVENGCESSMRLAITIDIQDPATPTTDKVVQNFCAADNATVADLDVNESNINIYDVETGGQPLPTDTVLVSGTYYVTQVDPQTGCESSIRLAITVNVTAVGTPTTTDDSQDFCLIDTPTVANIQVNEADVTFYDAAVGGNAFDTTEPLISGIYYAGFTNGLCASDVRLAITVTVNDPAVPTTNNTTQIFCQGDNPTVADIQVNETAVVFYDAANAGNAIDPSTPLVAGTYYVAHVENGCESSIRLAIAISIDDPGTPTTNSPSQHFCATDNPTVAYLQVNETNVVFFDAATGGNQLDSNTPLTDGIYYVAFENVICASAVRLEISVTIGNPGTPTTNSVSQAFCASDAPTVVDIQVNESGVVFFDAAVGGNMINPTEILTSGTYYASISDGNCESNVRLEITVTIVNPATPTTNDASQDFCLSDNPTVADLQVNETSVVFYTSPTGGTALEPTAALSAGTYYVAFVEGTCESTIRLEIAVSIGNPATPTTSSASQNFCQANNPTVADLDVAETDVVFYTTATGGTPVSATAALLSGTYYVALVENGCESSVRLEITVTVSGSATAEITGGSAQSCVSESVTYTTAPGMINYIWTIIGGTITAGGSVSDNTVTVEWNVAGTASVAVLYTDATCGNTASASLDVTLSVCSDLTITKVVDVFTPGIGEEVTFTITVNNSGVTHFTDVMINELLPTGYTLVRFDATAGVYVPGTGIWLISSLLGNTSATLTITVIVNGTGDYMNSVTIDDSVPDDSNVLNNGAEAWVEPICLVVFNEFTPNGDGQNETFRIDCIENYPNSVLQVFNRYGVLVYKMRNYQNNWDGMANQNSPVNQDKMLPAGTYYYVLELGDGTEAKQGWVYLMR
ncbi:Ig-like domain-containing protein [Flavobacterium silvaticum]|uniref:T9SS type B sorting domain-containing protein n=1 Tax=Flavobacterium silvaticum TaxID=1852020 RepID=A0A972FK03_9FLAO|nr:gliding motility-associated C-terminal domain-containing protein [Flavobacterium silvaticum]NMH27391.1 T9SS type B sorting domain-containing protein [Flavobacterium silvaticum]